MRSDVNDVTYPNVDRKNPEDSKWVQQVQIPDKEIDL
jgi:hypothetical protein